MCMRMCIFRCVCIYLSLSLYIYIYMCIDMNINSIMSIHHTSTMYRDNGQVRLAVHINVCHYSYLGMVICYIPLYCIVLGMLYCIDDQVRLYLVYVHVMVN